MACVLPLSVLALLILYVQPSAAQRLYMCTASGASANSAAPYFLSASSTVTINSQVGAAYSNNANCWLYLVAPSNCVVKFSFTYLYTELNSDFISFYNSNAVSSLSSTSTLTNSFITGAWGGTSSPSTGTRSSFPDAVSNTNEMALLFHSDASVTYFGLQGVASSVCSSTPILPPGVSASASPRPLYTSGQVTPAVPVAGGCSCPQGGALL